MAARENCSPECFCFNDKQAVVLRLHAMKYCCVYVVVRGGLKKVATQSQLSMHIYAPLTECFTSYSGIHTYIYIFYIYIYNLPAK